MPHKLDITFLILYIIKAGAMLESKIEWNTLIKEYLEENLSTEQSLYLQKMIARDPQLADLYEQMKDTHECAALMPNPGKVPNLPQKISSYYTDNLFLLLAMSILLLLMVYLSFK
jgi:hypothetical protein